MIAVVRRYYEAHPGVLDWTLLLAVTAVAAALRLTLLGEIPLGVHSDEAQVGTDAHRIVRDGWIGVYTIAALGQPTGHAYLTTPSIQLLGDNAFALRLPLALVGLAAVPLLWLLVRVAMSRVEATFAAGMLAVSYWHLLYSRVAHWSISYGTVLLAVLLCVVLGLKRRQPFWFVPGGLLLGLGVYTYNIYPIAVVAVVAFLAISFVLEARADRLAPGGLGRAAAWWAAPMLMFWSTALVVALPMIAEVSDPDSVYWFHINNYEEMRVTDTPEFRDEDALGKTRLLGEQLGRFASTYAWDGREDFVDGSGVRAVFDPVTLLLLVGGMVLAVRRWREPGRDGERAPGSERTMMLAALCVIAIVPLPAVLQTQSMMRQPVGAAPLLMFVAALPLAWLWRRFQASGFRFQFGESEASRGIVGVLDRPVMAGVAVVLAFGVVTATTVHDYFWTWRNHWLPDIVYYPPMTEASVYMRRLPPETQIYFYCERAPFNLETRQFLAPDAEATDRSREYGDRSVSTRIADPARPAAFVLLGAYVDEVLPRLRARYPDAVVRVINGGRENGFVAVEVAVGNE